MSELIHSITLTNHHTNLSTQADLYENIAAKQLDDIQNNWKPVIDQRVALLEVEHTDDNGDINTTSLRQAKCDLNVQDSHWDWKKKFNIYCNPKSMLTNRSFFVESDNETQAMMILGLNSRCQIPTQANQHQAYIEYIAVAPWNRLFLYDPRRFKGLGYLLMEAAIQTSIAEEFDGRLGLHSLPQSEEFYEGCGMINCGPDQKKQGLIYFENTKNESEIFLESCIGR